MDMETFFNDIRNGNTEGVAQAIVRNPELVRAMDQRGFTPLILASYYDRGAVVKLLLDHGAEVDEKDASGNTALMGACFKGYAEMVQLLLERGAKVNGTNAMGGSCLIYAVTFNRIRIAHMLLANGVDATLRDARGNTALDLAKMQGIPELIALLEGK